MHLNKEEQQQFQALLRNWSDTRSARQMRGFIQHGRVTTFDHCMTVAKVSFWLNRRLGLGADEKSLVRGAFLHDFYLYDWHVACAFHKWHGFRHPEAALKNASAKYPLNAREKDIIRSHMWPLTITKVPKCREAFLVTLVDKGCSLREIFAT